MMKIISLLLTLAVAMSASAQKKEFRLSCNLEGAGDSVKIYVIDLEERKQKDPISVVVKDNAFGTTMDLEKPVALMLYSVKGEELNPSGLTIVALPEEDCIIKGKWDDYTIDGCQFYKDFNDMESEISPIQKEIIDLSLKSQKRLEAGESQETVVADFQAKYTELAGQYIQKQKDYIMSHLDNEVSATLLSALDAEEMHDVYGKLSDNVKNGRLKVLVDAALKAADDQLAKQENAKKVAEGMPAPDFTLNDIEGKPLSLSSLRGKYVVLDFWGSWCGWCIKGIPDMKEYYTKYSGKFEILGIDCGDTEEKWKDAVKQHDLPWKHVYNPQDGNVPDLYAIQGYPTKIVIDPQGNIAKVVVGEDPAFYTYLDELFK